MTSMLKLRSLLDPFDQCQLECDGFSRIASRILKQAEIEHKVLKGAVIVHNSGRDNLVSPHYWIECNNLIVDYRLRMWCGDYAPHGVFVEIKSSAEYLAEAEVELPCSDVVFHILTAGADNETPLS